MPDVIINGPEGRIEGRYHHVRAGTAPMALVLHPHPLHGGTMNNRVVYTVYQTFVRRGFSTLRFNFRGVGRSQGSFDRGEGELADAAAALDWLQTYNPNAASCWVAGYSFGAWIGMQLLMRRPEIEAFISIAPPANSYDFSFLAPCPSSGLILHGDQDSAVPPELGSEAGAQAVASARHQNRVPKDPRGRSFLRRPRAAGASRRYVYRSASALRRAGTCRRADRAGTLGGKATAIYRRLTRSEAAPRRGSARLAADARARLRRNPRSARGTGGAS